MSGENGGSKVPSDGCNAVRKHGDDAAEADSSNARFTVTVYTCRFFLTVWGIRQHVEHLCHDKTSEQATVRNCTLIGYIAEDRVVFIQNGKFAILIGRNKLATVGSLHSK